MIDSEQGLQIVTVDRHDFDASDEALHDALMDAMRPVDATTLLPGAHFDATTGTFHNIIVDLDACEERVPHKIFGADWGHGAALIRLDGDNANQICERLVSSVDERRKILDRALKDIANEVSDPNVEVGPNLACTESNRDLDEDVWQCGFDSPECSVGLYSTTEDTIPCGIGVGGMRPRRAFYLVVRAGAGKAAQQFHAKFVAATNDGSSMQDVLSSRKITDTDFARVVSAGKRNRARILLAFAKALGLDTEVDTTYDSAAAQDCRDQHAMVHMDVVTNVLVAPCDGKMTWRYHSGSIDPTRSTGIVMASTPTDGFVVCMDDPNKIGRTAVATVVNSVDGSAPFRGNKYQDTKNVVDQIVDAHVNKMSSKSEHSHPDSEYVTSRFAWHCASRLLENEKTAELSRLVQPCSLWGTQAPLMQSRWARNLSLHLLHTLRLFPEAVLIGCDETVRVKSIVKAVMTGLKPD